MLLTKKMPSVRRAFFGLKILKNIKSTHNLLIMNSLSNKFLGLVLLALVALAGACVVEPNFDEPPTDIGTTTPAANTTINDLKARLTNLTQPLLITDDLIIRGTVISDDRAGNFYKQLVIQDETGGLEIETYGTFLYTQFPVGRTVAVRCKGLSLFSDNGLIRLVGGTYEDSGRTNTVGLTDAQIRSNIVKGPLAATLPEPRVVTLQDIADNPLLLSTLIRIENVQFVAGDTSKTYAEFLPPSNVNRTLETCSGDQIILRNSGFADFANVKLPSGKGSITAVVGTYREDRQLVIRDLSDVVFSPERCTLGGGGGACAGGVTGSSNTVTSIDEPFTTSTANQNINLADWVNFATIGGRVWRGATFQNDTYAQATAFGSSDALNETWLISPAIDVSSQRTFSFSSSWSYYRHQGLSVWYSTDFGSKDICDATWQPLNATIAQSTDGSGNFGNWIPSGNVALPVIAGGKIYIGFKYIGDKGSNTTTWRIDNVKLQ
jgi:hypothetical protein